MKNSPRVAAVSALIGAFLSLPPSSASHADPAHPGRRTGISSSGGPAVRGRETAPRLGRRDAAGGRIGLGIHQVSPAVHRMAETRTDRERLVRWWTPARMRRADPLDDLVALQTTRRPVPGGLPSETPASSPSAGAAWTSGGGVAHTTGRVFFTYQGHPASCSGNAVTSANQSTVITAGHCVRLDRAWHTDWVFVPGYHDGQAPYGKWTAMRTLTTAQWEAREDLDYDVGVATVAPLNGRTLTSVVGGQGIAFNQRRHRPMYAFGYPAEAPYDGSKLVYCSGTAKEDPGKTHDLGLTCDMTAGSSGGPWFTGFDDRTGTGTQNSLNSFKYNALPNEMFGPYFGTAVQALYDKAQNT
ncbi:peptidase [Actinoallomurus purpureus]|uniref:trypsin-like serine peptidase n=1 Tax=Actinoallomurus purpureus TaxID=478114 RepID=UPI00209302E0|nr:peptidase [Actinoallomurus purpureus]MCO6011074.1 peptidase [Actinoallomurus purpureus]